MLRLFPFKWKNTKMYAKFVHIFLLLYSVPCYSNWDVTQYPKITEEIWHEVSPYLLPYDHSVKNVLDEILANPNVFNSIDTLKQAGFEIVKFRHSRQMVTAKHPKLKKHLLKLYLHYFNNEEWHTFLHRIKGAELIQANVDKNGYNEYFKVPKKWLYPLSIKDTAPQIKKHFVLVVQDMEILKEHQNRHKLKNDVTKDLLKALYKTLKEVGYSDCEESNIPFSVDGRIAFIDTEYYNVWPVHYKKLTPCFSAEMQAYWTKLIKKN